MNYGVAAGFPTATFLFLIYLIMNLISEFLLLNTEKST